MRGDSHDEDTPEQSVHWIIIQENCGKLDFPQTWRGPPGLLFRLVEATFVDTSGNVETTLDTAGRGPAPRENVMVLDS
jgi:hypothetical protein